MYKVNYYTLAKCNDGTIGNIKQYSDTWYTEQKIEVRDDELSNTITTV